MRITGYIVAHERGGTPIYASFDKKAEVARALAVEYLERLGHGKRTWNMWADAGYVVRKAAVDVLEPVPTVSVVA